MEYAPFGIEAVVGQAMLAHVEAELVPALQHAKAAGNIRRIGLTEKPAGNLRPPQGCRSGLADAGKTAHTIAV